MNYAEYSEKDIRYTRIEISILSLLSKNFPFDVRENSPRRLYFPNQIPSSMQTKVDTKSIYINFHRPNIPFDNKEGREASLSHFSLIKPPTLVHCLKT